jgi:regulator of PEP synthase PpsR (kinase-PPPase family)
MVKNIYLFSDATGETVERIVRAAMFQFREQEVRVRRFNRLLTREDVLHAMEEAARQPGIIVYTLVNPVLAELVRTEAEAHEMEMIDLITPLLYKLASFLGTAPKEEPGLQYQVDAEYLKRVEAVNFTVKHDDGQELRNLFKADIVLVGVSRSSKTPLSMYLAHKGYKVANVPLVKGLPVPAELGEVDPDRVVGLTIDARRLIEIRSSRLRNLRQPPRGSYANFEQVEEELEFSRKLYRQHPRWMVIDVTNKSVEESAAEIVAKKFALSTD